MKQSSRAINNLHDSQRFQRKDSLEREIVCIYLSTSSYFPLSDKNSDILTVTFPCHYCAGLVLIVSSHIININNHDRVSKSKYQRRTSSDLGFPASTTIITADGQVSEPEQHRKASSYLGTSCSTRGICLGYGRSTRGGCWE
jgi:hypothetical protein